MTPRKKYDAHTLSVTILHNDIEPMQRMVDRGDDTSGILAHILEMFMMHADAQSVDSDLDTDVQ